MATLVTEAMWIAVELEVEARMEAHQECDGSYSCDPEVMVGYVRAALEKLVGPAGLDGLTLSVEGPETEGSLNRKICAFFHELLEGREVLVDGRHLRVGEVEAAIDIKIKEAQG